MRDWTPEQLKHLNGFVGGLPWGAPYRQWTKAQLVRGIEAADEAPLREGLRREMRGRS